MIDGTPTKRFVIDFESPYHLHPSEEPGLLIMDVILDGKNYDLSEMAVRTALKAKNKLGFIEETLVKPAAKEGDTSELQAWEAANSMILSWILNVIDPELRISVAYAAKSMWGTWKKQYAIGNTSRIHQLKTSIAN